MINIYNTNITITRRSLGTQGSIGEQTETWNTVYTNIPARIENTNSKVQYRVSTERDVNFTIIYIPPLYVPEVEDKIHQGATYLGIASGVNPALGIGGGTDHYEIIIENP